MSSWAKHPRFVLLFLVFVFSCEEDNSVIGFRKENQRFEVRYAELDVPSSVILWERLATFNNANQNRALEDGDQRLLIGQYQDNTFGTVQSVVYTQYGTPISSVTVGATAVVDSIVLQLKTDFYYYGGAEISNQNIQVFELLDTLNQANYFNTTQLEYGTELLGETSVQVNPAEFDQAILDNTDGITTNDRIRTYHIHLKKSLGNDLLEAVKSDIELVNNFEKFTGRFKGFALVPNGSDKILGINPRMTGDFSAATDTKLVVYFTDGDSHKSIDFILFPHSNVRTGLGNPVAGFSSISVTPTGGPLSSLTEPHKDFYPMDDKRYLESGVGILTKLDFTSFFNYMDTISNAVFNSAELVFTGDVSEFDAPPRFQLRAMDSKNQFRSAAYDTLLDDGKVHRILDAETVAFYSAATQINDNGTMDIKGDNADVLYTSSGLDGTVSAFITQFTQVQFGARNSSKRMNYVAFMPRMSQFNKTVNRFVFGNNIKLRLYYTTPKVEPKDKD